MPSTEFEPSKRFRIVRRLGEGGMGVVYEAMDLEAQTRVALKTLREVSGEALLRFKREFRSLQDLQHRNLVSLGELFCDDGQWYFSMEIVDGVDFLNYVRPGWSQAPAASGDDTVPSPWVERQRLTASRLRAHSEDPPGLSRADGSLDHERLRGGLLQLAEALVVLHRAHKVHRDIKPSNIRIASTGRLVLLDFGLVSDVDGDECSVGRHIVGTTAYMAPEQAAGGVGPEADWFSVGVLIHRALTGKLPFPGGPSELLMRADRRPPDPRVLDAKLPPDLCDLSVALMQIEPSARPTGREVLRLLRGPNATTGRGVSITGPRTTQGSDSRIFVGRIRELGTLWKALHETEQGHAVTVIVEGESGVGKSALVHRFVEECRGADEKTVVLTGSCRERESVPYNAIDGVIDALSRFMIEISHADAMGLLPHRAHLLGQVFPVLRRVEAIAQVPRAHHDALDPIELRNRVFGALRELFDRLAARQRIIVVIDDIQWADADSKALLRELVRPPDEPPLLVVATLRTQSAPVSRDLRMTDANLDKTVEAMPGHVERVCVGSLPMEEAHSLALMLRERVSPELHVDAAAIAEEAGGHPLFIDELVRHAALGASPGGSLRLDDALWSRICRLDPTARTLLELVALMGRPVAREVLVRAADSPADLQQSLRGLRLGNLIRTSGGRREDLIETYHDRVREAVLARMDTGLKRSLEERLAITLEGIQPPDFEALALHWSGAGDRERAAVNAAHAAGQAASSLAFDHASRLYRKALDLWPREGEEGARLWGALAEALANTGRGTEAAEAYRTAAQWASDSMALGFRERAAEQLLRAGHIDAGLKEVRGILALVGLSLPRTPLGAFLSYLWQRLLLRIRGLGFRERSVGEVSPNALSVVDLCWSLAFTMWIVDTMRGYEAQTRHLRLALRAGEPYRVARALALEVPYAAMFTSTGWRAIDPLYDRATSLADRVGNAHGRAIVTTCAGVSAYLLGAFKTSLALCDEAEELLRKCTGTWGEIARARTFGMQALSMIGALKELSRRTPVFLREATERSDKYAATTIRTGHPNVCWLVHDDPVGAHREIDEAMAGWPQKQGFHLEHYYTLLARVQAYLYADKPDEAWKEMSTAWPQLERSFLLRVPSVRRQALFLYGRAALAKAQSDLAYRSELQHLARTLARRLRYREKLPWCVAMGDLLDAGVVHLEGNRQRTITLLATASASFAHSDMALHVAAVDLVRGSMLGGDEGTQLVDKASTWAAQETVRDMSKLTAMLIPGFSTLR